MQVFCLSDPKLGGSWKVAQMLANRNTYYNPTQVGEDNENDDQGTNNEVYQENKCIGGNIVIVENSTMLRKDDSTILIDELYVQFDVSMFIDDNPSIEKHNTNSDNKEELSSNYDTESEHTKNSKHKQSSSSNNDSDYDTE
jgi:hypothetical protein